MTTTTMTNEQDLRLRLLNTLLTTPHRNLAEIWPVHRDMASADPRFYVRLAAWYNDRGDVRDHKEMFAVTLILSDFGGHRDVGLALLRQMPPYQVLRVLDFIHGRKTTRKVRAPKAKARAARTPARPATPARARTRRGMIGRVVDLVTGGAPTARPTEPDRAGTSPTPVPPEQAREASDVKLVTEDFGLFRNPPRSLRTEIVRYLREREADADWFDSTVLVSRKQTKRLYALLHVKPGERAQRILFDEDPPRDSRLFALRELAKATDPAEQARAIVDHQIPYRVAATVVRQMTPTVLMALVDRMSPQELINNVASLTKRGAFDNADIKALIELKLEEAKTAGRVSALKTGKAVDATPGVSADVKAKLEAVADTQVKAKGRIARPTALLIDKSGSMSLAIELGKRIASLISAVCEKELFVYAFDTMAYPIVSTGDDLASWERALTGITAGGGTSCGAAVEYMRVKRQYVEQIILVTDEGENASPHFLPALQKYRESLRADPTVCIVRTPNAHATLETQLRAASVAVDVFQFAGDYYALPNLVPLLSKPSKLELLMEIMEFPLPKRKAA